MRNIPYTLAQLQYEKIQIDLATPERVFNAVLARTDDLDKATQALTSARMTDAMQKLQ